MTLLEALVMCLSVSAYLHLQPLAQRVYAGDANTMQTARHFVAVVIELAAGVERRENDGDGRFLLGRVNVNRNASPVVVDTDRSIRVDRDVDMGAEARQGFVDTVVRDLVDAVVKTAYRRVANVHRRTLPNSLDSLENRDVRSVVFRPLFLFRHRLRLPPYI